MDLDLKLLGASRLLEMVFLREFPPLEEAGQNINSFPGEI
jgi:hypothetical protein